MNDSVNILVTGDTFLGGGRVKDLALKNSVDVLFGNFISKIKKADISVTNLESPLIENGTPIFKTGPNLKSPVKTIEVLKNAGFNLLTLANNHILDYGEDGIISTLESCQRAEIGTVGAGINEAKKHLPFVVKVKGISLSIINIAENEFIALNEKSAGAHALNPIKNYKLIKECSNKFDHTIVIVHGGHENYNLPSPRMKETYRFFVNAGASAVVGHHPHCYSGYEEYKDSLIFYSIGNFLFDNIENRDSMWNEGYMVELICKKNNIDFKIIPYVQNGKSAGLNSLSVEEKKLFDKKLSDLNLVIQRDSELEKKFSEYCESKLREYNAYLEPYSNRYLHALRNRNLFPSFITCRKRTLLLNLVRCEAHRDVLKKILQK